MLAILIYLDNAIIHSSPKSTTRSPSKHHKFSPSNPNLSDIFSPPLRHPHLSQLRLSKLTPLPPHKSPSTLSGFRPKSGGVKGVGNRVQFGSTEGIGFLAKSTTLEGPQGSPLPLANLPLSLHQLSYNGRLAETLLGLSPQLESSDRWRPENFV